MEGTLHWEVVKNWWTVIQNGYIKSFLPVQCKLLMPRLYLLFLKYSTKSIDFLLHKLLKMLLSLCYILSICPLFVKKKSQQFSWVIWLEFPTLIDNHLWGLWNFRLYQENTGRHKTELSVPDTDIDEGILSGPNKKRSITLVTHRDERSDFESQVQWAAENFLKKKDLLFYFIFFIYIEGN